MRPAISVSLVLSLLLLALTPSAAVGEAAPVSVFVAAHQDDELLSMGSSIAEHVAAGGQVVVVPATDGSATVARFELERRLGREVTPEQVTMYRDAEMRWTVQTGLGASFAVPPQGVRQGDGRMGVEGATAVLDWVRATWPGARIKTHSPWDTHPDHAALGVAATRMHEAGLIEDLRLYIPNYIWTQKDWDFPPVGTTRRQEAVDAQAAYRLWAPPPDGSDRVDRYFQVGYISVAPSFDQHATDPASRFHAPAGLPAHTP